MAGAGGTVEDVGVGRVGFHVIALGRWIHFLLVGREKVIDAGVGETRAVVFEGAGVIVEVFVGAELQAIDEDAGDDHVRVFAGLTHQTDVAVVEVAHGGYKSHAGLMAGVGERGAQAGDGRMDLHVGFQ